MHGVPDITAITTLVFNGKLAPKGQVFIVVTCKKGKTKYAMHSMVSSQLTKEQEQEIKVGLAFELKKHYKL